jgi:hypothetical protein
MAYNDFAYSLESGYDHTMDGIMEKAMVADEPICVVPVPLDYPPQPSIHLEI